MYSKLCKHKSYKQVSSKYRGEFPVTHFRLYQLYSCSWIHFEKQQNVCKRRIEKKNRKFGFLWNMTLAYCWKHFVMWCDVMWCDVMWCDVMWCDVMWCDVMWCDVIWVDLIWVDLIWFDLIWFDLIRFDLIWIDLIWFDLIWFDLIWFDLI